MVLCYNTRMKKILLIGSDDSIRQTIESEGIEVMPYRAIRFEPLPFKLDDTAAFDWVFFGSRRGASVFLDTCPELLRTRKIGGVGSRTAAFLKKHGVDCDFIPETYSSRHWPEEFVRKYPQSVGVLYPTSDRSAMDCPELFRSHDIRFRRLVVYRTVCDSRDLEHHPDAFVFASPSCYDCFVETHGRNLFAGRLVTAIGDVTFQHIQADNVPCVMPERFTVKDALDHTVNILKHIQRRQKGEENS